MIGLDLSITSLSSANTISIKATTLSIVSCIYEATSKISIRATLKSKLMLYTLYVLKTTY